MESTNVKKSELKLDTTKKILHATLKGFFKPDDAEYFVKEYTKNVKSVNATEYELHFDCRELKVSSQDMVPMLSACLEMYKKDDFKKILFDCGTNSALKLQVRRVAGSTGLTNYELV